VRTRNQSPIFVQETFGQQCSARRVECMCRPHKSDLKDQVSAFLGHSHEVSKAIKYFAVKRINRLIAKIGLLI